MGLIRELELIWIRFLIRGLPLNFAATVISLTLTVVAFFCPLRS